MTREQTIEKLKALYINAVAAMLKAHACDDDDSAKVMTEYAETLDSAITALKTDGDCISRQAAIDKAKELFDMGDCYCDKYSIVGMINSLPSVQPTQPNTSNTLQTLDCVDRQAAIDALNEYFVRIGKLKRRGLTKGEKAISLDTVGAIKTLPSVQPLVIHCTDCEDWYKSQNVWNIAISELPSVQPEPHYTDDQIQKMQDLEQAQLDKAFELGRKNAKWIPCSERLPDKEGNYLMTAQPTYNHTKDIRIAHWSGRWVGYVKYEILAWMPLPEPYRAERRTDE